MDPITILTADIGGTTTRIRIYTGEVQQWQYQQEFASALYPSLEKILAQVFQEQNISRISYACIAVAGPVEQGQTARITNLPWIIAKKNLAQLGIFQQIHLLNDFEALGYALEHFQAQDLLCLQQGRKDLGGSQVVLGAGTGLGEAGIKKINHLKSVYPSEGGHCHFAPENLRQWELWRFLSPNYSRISRERILSGQGIIHLAEFLCQQHPVWEPDLAQLRQQNPMDLAALIAQQAREGHSLAQASMALFMEIYGQVAGDVALSHLPYGGIYIAGGIAAKNLNLFQEPEFMRGFLNKGRMADLVAQFPLYVIQSPHGGLLGAYHYALMQLQTKKNNALAKQ